MDRPDKDEYYLNIALEISTRSTCLRRHFGAVIVRDDVIHATGYNGPARGAPNCLENGCLKDKYKMRAGMAYDVCRAGPLHAEVNAITSAGREKALGACIYIAGEYADGRGLSDSYPCKLCQKQIINAGIEKVVIKMADGEKKEFIVKDWVKEAYSTEEKDIKGFY